VALHEILAMLRSERDRLDKAIEAPEQLEQEERQSELPKSRAGRKSMGAEERKAISKRMKRYWQTWRARHPRADDAAS
jgi:hypothetical protein